MYVWLIPVAIVERQPIPLLIILTTLKPTQNLIYGYIPMTSFFERLEVDTPQTLKFRKQNYYMDINKTKYEKITGNRYQNKWWMNKNPQIIFPILGWIRIKTRASNLWKRFGEQDNLLKASIIINIILSLITIWSLFFKKN